MNILLENAKLSAYTYHTNHYGKYSYVHHLDMVYDIAKRYSNNEQLRVATYLHDLIEDTVVTYTMILNKFGLEIAEMVFLVTNELGRNRHERLTKTINKICEYKTIYLRNLAIELKLCDRIANIEFSIKTKNTDKVQMYSNEHHFMDTLIQRYTGDNLDLIHHYLNLVKQ